MFGPRRPHRGAERRRRRWWRCLVALLLGLRHATDPDHLTAVSTLVMSDDDAARAARRRSARRGGSGHAHDAVPVRRCRSCCSAALPAGRPCSGPPSWRSGVVIVALGLRLLLRWRRGYFHAHEHAHGELRHAHPHVHEHAPDAGATGTSTRTGIPTPLGPLAAGGLRHRPDPRHRRLRRRGRPARRRRCPTGPRRWPRSPCWRLATAISMAAAVDRRSAWRSRAARWRAASSALAPVLGAASLLFGVWYALAALNAAVRLLSVAGG